MQRLLSTASVRQQILVSFGIIIAFNLAFSVISYNQLNAVNNYAEEVVPISAQIDETDQFADAVSALEVDLERYLVTANPQFEIESETNLVQANNALQAMQDINVEQTTTEVDALEQDFKAFENSVNELFALDFLALSANQKNQQIISIFSHLDDIRASEDKLGAKNVASLSNVSQKQQEIIASFLTQFLVLNIVSFLVAIVTSQLVSRRLATPVSQIAQAAMRMATGELHVRAKETNRQDEIGQLTRAFNSMANQLSTLIGDLENRVADRTRDLQVAGEVSRQITAVLDLDVLLTDVCDLTRDKFGIYHVSVFLKDEEAQKLRLAAGSGEAGAKMLAIAKSFKLDGQGLVPLAARNRQEVVIHDVLLSETHLPNPFLPNTRSEIAFPMIIGDEVLGVLDLQTEDAHHFNEDDIQAFKTLAEQIAIAVRNAKLYEDTKQAHQAAELANNVKSQFLASMSHELRTPLNAIINFSKFVARGMMGPVVDAQVDTLTNVINSAEHLLSLINDVLDISKIESGSLTLYKEDNVDIEEIVKSVESTALGLIEDKPIALTINVDPNLPLVQVDPQRILQVLLNVVSNACKFTKEGEIKILVAHEHNNLKMTVSDTGPGIAPKDQPSVFEKFMQTETGLRQGGGTGLGMPISKSLVEAHGGRIWIESEVGQGASFYIELPIEETANY